MGTRKQREKQEELWTARQELVTALGHSFYQKVNELLRNESFDVASLTGAQELELCH